MMRRFGALFFACRFNGTFNLPNLDRRVISGAGSDVIGSTSEGSLPAIKGTFGIFGQWNTMLNEYSGAFTYRRLSSKSGSAGSYDQISVGDFDAFRSSDRYWRTDNQVHARNVKMYFCIKYI